MLQRFGRPRHGGEKSRHMSEGLREPVEDGLNFGCCRVLREWSDDGLVFSIYVTVASYQCAGNCRSKALARMAQICAVVSLVLLPVFAYLDFTGALELALTGLRGEQ